MYDKFIEIDDLQIQEEIFKEILYLDTLFSFFLFKKIADLKVRTEDL